MTDPFSIAILAGSPARPSRTAALADHLEQRFGRGAFRARTIHVRELPAEALLRGDVTHPDFQAAQQTVEKADGVVIASPVYKAAYTGVLKSFLDLLPQFALRGKVVLPLLTGGSLAHVLALDYGLRPVLQSLDARSITAGLFLVDKWIQVAPDGAVTLEPEIAPRFDAAVQQFVDAIHAYAQL
jgi:FMN reductase